MVRTCLMVGLALAVVMAVTGCGGGGGGEEDTTADYLPLAVNNFWSYTFTDFTAAVATTAGVSASPRQRSFVPRRNRAIGTRQVSAEEYVRVTGITQIGGSQWYEVVAQYAGGDPSPSAYVRHNADGLQRRESRDADPYYLLKNPIRVGTTWTDEIDPNIQLTITGVGQTAPGSTYNDCVVVEDLLRVQGEQDDIITSWYMRGVGLVREEHYVGPTLVDVLELLNFTPGAA